MQFIPLIASAAVAFVLAPAIVAGLRRSGIVRENYRGATVVTALGIAIVVSALIALGPVALLDELADTEILRADFGLVLLYTLGVALLGLIDDLLGGRASAGAAPSGTAPRGWRGHAGAAARGSLSTGALKAVGALGLALFALSGQGQTWYEYLLGVAVLVLATNFFNLVDLRPGRAIKCLAVVGAALAFFWWTVIPLQTLGLLLGPAAVIAGYDLREKAMLGDVGSNLLGALTGFWLILTLSTAAQLAALVVLIAITVYGEFRSISALVDRNPLLRRLDSFGRLRTPTDSHHQTAQGGTDG